MFVTLFSVSDEDFSPTRDYAVQAVIFLMLVLSQRHFPKFSPAMAHIKYLRNHLRYNRGIFYATDPAIKAKVFDEFVARLAQQDRPDEADFGADWTGEDWGELAAVLKEDFPRERLVAVSEDENAELIGICELIDTCQQSDYVGLTPAQSTIIKLADYFINYILPYKPLTSQILSTASQRKIDGETRPEEKRSRKKEKTAQDRDDFRVRKESGKKRHEPQEILKFLREIEQTLLPDHLQYSSSSPQSI